MPRAPGGRAALAACGLALLGGAAAVSARLPVSPDGRYSMAWGAHLLRGALPDLAAPELPTPHPLPIALGGLLSIGGPRFAADAYAFLGVLAFAVLVAAAYHLGRLAGGGALAGVVAAALVATRPRLEFFASRTFIDVPFAALVLVAAAVAADDPRRRATPALALLAAAGLLRPEAWGLAALYALWLARRRALTRSRALLALAAPACWLGFDLALTGDALHSLTSTQDLAVELERDTGVGKLWPSLTDGLGDLAGAGAVAGGAAVAAARARCSVPVAVLAVLGAAGTAAFCVIAVAGLPLNDRYLLLPALALLVLGASALGQARRSALAAVAAALALAPAVVALPGDLGDTRAAFEDAASKRRADEDLERLAGRPTVAREVARCRGVIASGTARAAVASLTSRDPADVGVAEAPVPPSGSGAFSTAETVAPGTARVVRRRAWAFVSRC